jgi:omega-6 fatty acid desaturase (delta-12 desaturase)
MQQPVSPDPAGLRERNWTKLLAQYRGPRRLRSTIELLVTVVSFALLWTLCAAAVHFSFWPGLLLTIPAAGFLLRLFMIQHDCGHGAFFAHRRVDDWTGRALGVLTLTPYDYWRRAHAAHHATAGNLDERGVGDITTLTVREFNRLRRWERLGYRLYRNPLVMFGLGPIWVFGLRQRLPFGMMRGGVGPWTSTMATNAALIVLVAALIWILGIGTFLMVHLPIVLIAGAAGIWLFYVQHQFEDTHWSSGEDWNFSEAALHGSSYYELPAVLNWITGNIGVHHVHHLSSRVPCYRLPEVLRDFPELKNISRITIADSLRCVRLTLWDEEQKRLVSFGEARASE